MTEYRIPVSVAAILDYQPISSPADQSPMKALSITLFLCLTFVDESLLPNNISKHKNTLYPSLDI